MGGMDVWGGWMKEGDEEEGQYLQAPCCTEEKEEGHQCPERWGEQLNGHQWPENSASVILRSLHGSSLTATE